MAEILFPRPEPFKLDASDATAQITFVVSTSKYMIDVESPWVGLTPIRARKFALWLIKASQWVDAANSNQDFIDATVREINRGK